jgi:hypothetical protein
VIGVTAVGLGVNAEAHPDFPRQRRGPGPKTVVGVVRAPFDHLDAVEAARHAGERNIADGDAPAGPAQMIPERLTLHEFARVTAKELVGAGSELDEAVDAVTGRRDAGVERGPGRADEEAVHAFGVTD